MSNFPATHRGSRCGVCYWALYDGEWCQNTACKNSGKSVGENRVRLTNDEAQILIQANVRQVKHDRLKIDE